MIPPPSWRSVLLKALGWPRSAVVLWPTRRLGRLWAAAALAEVTRQLWGVRVLPPQHSPWCLLVFNGSASASGTLELGVGAYQSCKCKNNLFFFPHNTTAKIISFAILATCLSTGCSFSVTQTQCPWFTFKVILWLPHLIHSHQYLTPTSTTHLSNFLINRSILPLAFILPLRRGKRVSSHLVWKLACQILYWPCWLLVPRYFFVLLRSLPAHHVFKLQSWLGLCFHHVWHNTFVSMVIVPTCYGNTVNKL